MHHNSLKQRQSPVRAGGLLKLAPVAAGCAALLMTAGGAYAQQAATSLNTVTVTGIRKGIEDAISVKKNSDSIVEAISAEDIGKLPDISIAESIARLPGLAAQRVAGRAQVISIRGLSPDFSTTLLNGREQVSTGDNRSVEFDQYPSELISGVVVYKTPDAGIVGQGLSGTVDMQSVRPLNFPGRTFSVNARAENNSLGSIANASSNGNRFSISYIDQSADRTVGWALGFAHLQSPILDHETGLYEPWHSVNAGDRPGLAAGTYTTDGIKSLAKSGYTKRDGFMGVLEFRPSKTWSSTLDVYASEFKSENTSNQFEVNLGNYNGGYSPGLQWSNVTLNGTTQSGGVASGVYPLVRGMYDKTEDSIRAAGWSNKFKFDNWSLFADLNYSKANKNELSLENNAQISTAAGAPFLDSVTVNYPAGGFPTLRGNRDYSSPSSLYIRNTIYGSGYGKTPRVEDELTGAKVVATFPLGGMFADADVGLSYTDRSKKKRQPEGGINLAGAPTTIPADLMYAPVDLGFAGSGTIPSWNVPGVVSRYMVFAPVDNLNYLISKAWDVKEKVTTTFFKANIDTSVGGASLRGNIGVQVQRTDQSSASNYYDGTAPAGSQVKPVEDGKSYTDVLPSMNLVFGLADQNTVRIGLAKQLARPRVDQLRSALDFGVSDTTFKPGASGGNARLDPWRANAFDISWEKYFDTKGYVAAAFFYKDLVSYIYTQTLTYDFSKFTPGTKAKTNFGDYTAPYNGQGGSLRGLELSGSFPLKMLTPALDGFGIQASLTYNDSSVKIQEPDSNIGTDIPLPGLSKNVSNLTLYYEKNGFEARISQRRRADFVGEIGNFANNRTLRYVVGENIVDFQIGYNFTEGTYKGLGLLLQVNNLGDAAYETYAGTRDKQLEYQKYGRSVLAGVTYKF